MKPSKRPKHNEPLSVLQNAPSHINVAVDQSAAKVAHKAEARADKVVVKVIPKVANKVNAAAKVKPLRYSTRCSCLTAAMRCAE